MKNAADNSLNGARILVTGATGFIGRHLVRRLLSAGATPDLVVRPESIDAVTREAGPCKLHVASLNNTEALGETLRNVEPDIVFHLGAYTDPARDPKRAGEAMKINLDATIAMTSVAQEIGTSVFVASGTSEEYGRQNAPFHEDLPERPLSPYSASKAAATIWMRMMHETHGFPGVIVRPFLVYGPGQPPPKLVPSAVLAAVNDQDFPMTSGEQMRELTYIDDLVEGILAAAIVPQARGGVFNLGSGDERRVRDIVEKIYDLAGGKGVARPGAIPERSNDMQRFAADTTRAAEVLGWRAHTPLDVGLATTINWARQQGDTPVPLSP